MVWPAEHATEMKRMDKKVDHRGLGVQRRALQGPPIAVPSDLCK